MKSFLTPCVMLSSLELHTTPITSSFTHLTTVRSYTLVTRKSSLLHIIHFTLYFLCIKNNINLFKAQEPFLRSPSILKPVLTRVRKGHDPTILPLVLLYFLRPSTSAAGGGEWGRSLSRTTANHEVKENHSCIRVSVLSSCESGLQGHCN